jgi:predicted Zn finger-like uncharacterized protein
MLICCPKCHSIYEISDDLIGKTGRMFRCQACSNVWHALREDALDYEANTEDAVYVEPIEVSEPPARRYPANRKNFTVPADGKSGVRTRSSDEILMQEGIHERPQREIYPENELTLTSDHGTSFTIRTDQEIQEKNMKKAPHLFERGTAELTALPEDRFATEKPFKGYKKTVFLIWILFIAALLLFFRRDIVTFYPQAEAWYQKIHLSGLNNEQYLSFGTISLDEATVDGENVLNITAEIKNDSRFLTRLPDLTISGVEKTFPVAEEDKLLSAHEAKKVNLTIPAPKSAGTVNLTLGFAKPE